MRWWSYVSAAALLPIVVASVPARAASTFYTDPSSYNAAAPGNMVVNFDGNIPGYYPTPGILADAQGDTVDSVNSLLFVVDNYYADNAATAQYGPGTNDLEIQLANPASAVSLDLGSFYGSTFTVTLSNGDSTQVSTPPYDGLAFVGATSGTPITGITITGPSTVFDVNGNPNGEVMNLVDFGYVPATPLPSAAWGGLALIGGVGGLRLFRGQRAAV